MGIFIFSRHHKQGRSVNGVRGPSRIPYDKRDAILKRLGFLSYRDYLNSKDWKAIRIAVLATTDACEICRCAKASQVHHLAYNRAALTGRDRTKLVALCGECHRRVEFRQDGGKRGFEAMRKTTKKLLKKTGRWEMHLKDG